MTPNRRRFVRFLAASTGLGACVLGVAAWHFTRAETQRGYALVALRNAGWTGDIGEIAVGADGRFFRPENIAVTDPSRAGDSSFGPFPRSACVGTRFLAKSMSANFPSTALSSI